MEENKVVIRKRTEEEEKARVEEQIQREYEREQLRNAERMRSERVRKLYEKDKKKRLLASVINLVLLGIAVFVQYLVAVGAIGGTVGMLITMGIVAASIIVLRVLTHKKKEKE